MNILSALIQMMICVRLLKILVDYTFHVCFFLIEIHLHIYTSTYIVHILHCTVLEYNKRVANSFVLKVHQLKCPLLTVTLIVQLKHLYSRWCNKSILRIMLAAVLHCCCR